MRALCVLIIQVALFGIVACSGSDDDGPDSRGTGSSSIDETGCVADPDSEMCVSYAGFPRALKCNEGVDLDDEGCQFGGEWGRGGSNVPSQSGPIYCCPQ